MFKLVAISGPLRGQEFSLSEGQSVLGRSPECDHPLKLDGISKRHVRFSLNNKDLWVEDLKSSNGTLVNGQMVSRCQLGSGDKVALPGVIFQVVAVKEQRMAGHRNETAGPDQRDVMPEDPIGKVKFLFRTRLMRPIYKINEEYEWSVVVGVFLSVFIGITIAITIIPILNDHKRVLLKEVSLRAAHYAEEIGRLNAVALKQRDLDRIDTNFLNREDGVESYELIDPDGRIIRPLNKINTYTNDTFTVRAREWAVDEENKSATLRRDLGEGQIGIAKRIKAYNPNLGYEELVGVIAIRFSPDSWVTTIQSNSISYLRALSLCLFVGLVLFGIYVYLTYKPITEMHMQLEEGLSAGRKELESDLLFAPLDPLRDSINTLLQRIRELESDGDGDFQDIEDDSQYVKQMEAIVRACPGAAMAFDSQKRIKKINSQAEDIIGLRETAALDEDLLDVSKEKGFAATVIELCDQSANTEGELQEGSYELGGHEYELKVVAAVGKDSFAKAYLLTFNREDL